MSFLKIDSANRRAGDQHTPGNFQIDLYDKILGHYELQIAFIPADYPVIEANVNDRIPFYENSTEKIATITPGYYNSSTILTAIGTAMTTASGGHNIYTATLNSITQCITITASTNKFYLQFGTQTTYSSAALLGFKAEDSSTALTATAPNPLALNQNLAFNIQIDDAGEVINGHTGQRTTFYIPMNADLDRREFIEYHPNFPQRVYFKEQRSRLHIKVLSDSGKVLNLKQNWQLLLKQI